MLKCSQQTTLLLETVIEEGNQSLYATDGKMAVPPLITFQFTITQRWNCLSHDYLWRQRSPYIRWSKTLCSGTHCRGILSAFHRFWGICLQLDFVRNIIPYNYNAVIRVMVRVIRYSRELVFQEAVLYALTVCRHPLRWFGSQHEQKEVLSCLCLS